MLRYQVNKVECEMQMKKIILLLAGIFYCVATFGKAIPVLVLSGHYRDMGYQYGQVLQKTLQRNLKTLIKFYTQQGLTHSQLIQQANLFYQRTPFPYQHFLQGEARGAQLHLNDVKILEAMLTLREALPHKKPVRCAFIFLPPVDTKTGAALIGRNFDYDVPFDRIAKTVVVTILHAQNTVPTAMIGMAGEIYCASCVNQNGLFMEVNSGSPSGGKKIRADYHRNLLASLLTISQHATSLRQINAYFKTVQPDYSLIINAANKNRVETVEFSTQLGMKFYEPSIKTPFVSTNFYLNPAWKKLIPAPTDKITWMGVTRRNHLLQLLRHKTLTVSQFKKIMSTPLMLGGAFWNATIYQLILDESNLSLYIKIPARSNQWTKVSLGKFLNHVNKK